MTARPDHGPSPLVREVPTPLGPARLHLHLPPVGGAPAGTPVLGHGAGGGLEAAALDAGAEPDTAADPGTAGGGDLGRGTGTGGPADITGGPADIRNRPLVVGG